MKDTYKTIDAPSMGEFRDRGSKFIAYAFPIYTEEDWQDHLLEVKKLHPKGRHHCYAYRIGLDGNNFRANDDGEPSGTAGPAAYKLAFRTLGFSAAEHLAALVRS